MELLTYPAGEKIELQIWTCSVSRVSPHPHPFSLSGNRRSSLSVSGNPTLALSPAEPTLSLSPDEPTIPLRPQLQLKRQQTQLLAYSPRALSLRSLLQVRRLGISDFSLYLRQPHPPFGCIEIRTPPPFGCLENMGIRKKIEISRSKRRKTSGNLTSVLDGFRFLIIELQFSLLQWFEHRGLRNPSQVRTQVFSSSYIVLGFWKLRCKLEKLSSVPTKKSEYTWIFVSVSCDLNLILLNFLSGFLVSSPFEFDSVWCGCEEVL